MSIVNIQPYEFAGLTIIAAMLALAFISFINWLSPSPPEYPILVIEEHEEEFSPEYDVLINSLIDDDLFELEDADIGVVGDLQIWIGLYPYGYGSPFGSEIGGRLLPSMKTRRRLKEHLDRKAVLVVEKKARAAVSRNEGMEE